MKAEVSLHCAKLSFCNRHSASCCGSEKPFKVASHTHFQCFGLALKLCTNLSLVFCVWAWLWDMCKKEWLYRAYIILNGVFLFILRKQRKMAFGFVTSLMLTAGTFSNFMTAKACHCASQSLCVYEYSHLFIRHLRKGKSAVSNDELLPTTMHCLYKQHWH